MLDENEVKDILERLRSGFQPTEAEADKWNVAATVHAFRGQIAELDLRWILPLAAETDGPRAAFYLSLLQPFSTREEVCTVLRKRFESASPYLKSQLLWRLLDDRELPPETHSSIFDFVMSDFDSFQQSCVSYLGGPAEILPAALRRMADCPPSKRWIYLCCLPQYAQDQHAVHGVLTIAGTSSDTFMAKVAHRLVAQFFGENL
jgi:hypothetical protein